MGHGLVFSIFMLSKMAGSQAFHALSHHLSPSSVLQLVFGGSALCLAAPLCTQSYALTLLAFCGFESLLGMYWPAIALLRVGSLDDSQVGDSQTPLETPPRALQTWPRGQPRGQPHGQPRGQRPLL